MTTIIDKIRMSFRFAGFEPYSVGFEETDLKQNNYEVTIFYNGKQLKFPYAFGSSSLEGLVTDVIENMFKLDILGKIVVDCYPPESYEKFKDEYKTKERGMTEQFTKSAYTDIVAQSDKLRTLFEESDLRQLHLELSDWFATHPNEAKSLGMEMPKIE